MNDITRYNAQPAAHIDVHGSDIERRGEGSSAAVSKTDEQLFASFASELSSQGIDDPRALRAARSWYADFVKTADAQQEKQDNRDIKACLQQLRTTWGPDHVSNMRLLNELMDQLPEAVALPLYEGRDGEGVRLLNNPALVDFIVGAKRAMDTPPVDLKRTLTDATELEEIQKLMGDRRSDYWRGPRAEKLQARYLELLEGK